MSAELHPDLEFIPQEFSVHNMQVRSESLASLKRALLKCCSDLCNSFECAQPDSDLTLTATADLAQPIRWRWRNSRLTDLTFYLIDADDEVRNIYLEPERVRVKLNYMLSAVAYEDNRLQQFIRTRQAIDHALSPIRTTT